MKKYNTPELKISMFNVESVLTASSASSDWATFDAYTEKNRVSAQEINWADVELQF